MLNPAAAVIVISGPPAAGKTTTSEGLATTYPKSVHLRADDFWHSIVSGGLAPHLPKSDAQNHVIMDVVAGAAFGYAAGGFTVIVDGVIGPWMLAHFLRKKSDFRTTAVHYIVLRPDGSTVLARARQRMSSNTLSAEGPILALWTQFLQLGDLEGHAIDTTSQNHMQTLSSVRLAVASERFRL